MRGVCVRVCGVYTGMCGKMDLAGYGFCSPCGWRMFTAVPQNGCPSGLLVPSFDSSILEPSGKPVHCSKSWDFKEDDSHSLLLSFPLAYRLLQEILDF